MNAIKNKPQTLALIGCLLGISLFATGCFWVERDDDEGEGHHRHHHDYGQAATMHIEQADCPVCGKMINTQIAADYQDKTVFFCSQGCKDEFAKNPESFEPALHQTGDKYLLSVVITQR
jgi:YHS domain-containing protein